MDKNRIKSFAIWARRSLIKSVSEKAYSIGIYEDKILEATAVQGGFKLEGKEEIFTLSKKDRDALVTQVREKGFEQVMEEVAYTWFNRFMGLRYMEVNDYLPSGVRILSSEVKEKKEPDVLTKVLEIIDELNLNANEIYDLLDTGDTLDREKAYRIILVKQCNELGKIIPKMFEKISDYTELLLPDNLLEEGSVIRRMVEDIEESDWREEVEIIGWMYQYYISEKKDEVFAALKKNVKITKENIPAATQLFTPKWIVKYMVENSLGRLWLEGHPNEELQREFKYYLEEAEQEQEVEEELKKIREEHAKLKPEDIKVLDPCMGSGHILVYAFDVLYEIYKTAGYSEREISRLILQNNLYGLDIDDRAAQLASFALIMKARHYNRRLFREIEREHLELNLCSIQESNSINKEVIDYFVGKNKDLRKDVEYLIEIFTDAKEYGSILEVEEVNFYALKQRLKEIEDDDNLMFGDYRKMLLEKLPIMIKQAEIMSIKYDLCVTNPPYMGNRNMNEKIKKYLSNKYEDSKMDLFSSYIERNIKYINNGGIASYMTPNVWFYINIYETLRKNIIENYQITSLIELEKSSFSDAAVSICTFVLRNYKSNYSGQYIRLNQFKGALNQDKATLNAIKNNVNYKYILNQKKFLKVTGAPLAFWISDKFREIFSNRKVYDISISDGQNVTSDNNRFVRKYWEVNYDKIGKLKMWRSYAKGGGYKKWKGNMEDVVNWSIEARSYYKVNSSSRIIPEYLWYKKGITWGLITSKHTSFRVLEESETFDKGGSSIFFTNYDEYYYLLGFLNSKVCRIIIELLNPTLNLQVKDVRNLPLIKPDEVVIEETSNLVKELINIAKWDWDQYENSLDFKNNFIVFNSKETKTIQGSINTWISEKEKAFNNTKEKEERLNKIYIELYGLTDEMNNKEDESDVSIIKHNIENDIKLVISYAIGCMFGRYSIDSEGLIYAGGDFNDKWNFESSKVKKIEKDDDGNIISDLWIDSIFMPDKDNIIPITEDEYFEDDMVSRFIDFVRTVYGNDTLEENLDFIADSIGRKASETARQAIRRYFIKDFYKDHLKVYQKRPIYWMLESGKNDGFKCLVYMHRYNEQTVAKVRTDYLHTLQRKYEAEINRLQLVVDSEEYTAKDRTAAKKKIDRISKQIEECREYDQVVAYLANEKISIDLDDGVKVNYAKFQNIKVINSKDKEVKMNLLAKI
ncbi:BREX-1 system adenine-specific DNA-methyltransferase PglX [Clostridium chauvoei]|uniref:site-specific DNA-methyltransferase (adenine-specific) n=1 Tax=Clostridium chauvoei TaxID=46867 RepID=A0ABD4RI07_9CLOT|nr:BREX-1 system adenine-specific DNA-methyltransferase PglX [Clostridium chauvoei]ATD55570.1 SAM-dependent methyltransferase [Clostridium chauvoei]ATD56754.1 SAM-dependent methyltransferase [Clostridium chauvoei]MBX7280941.1 BREX-1 system adenine-specific DNA-methyltransferase PglX [Clostridium chauvoei]MBX7283450.1 BREX-1 system adenine-specific DNA-methyltransferase PglX [Clostridium chauvoei]MBX7285973.1 BREX-1 system adenine-specific DNA-methyltransferase PglX [Clostridium chauvoei]